VDVRGNRKKMVGFLKGLLLTFLNSISGQRGASLNRRYARREGKRFNPVGKLRMGRVKKQKTVRAIYVDLTRRGGRNKDARGTSRSWEVQNHPTEMVQQDIGRKLIARQHGALSRERAVPEETCVFKAVRKG